jgi:DEAD/DEAH box helicase domain-containing protein
MRATPARFLDLPSSGEETLAECLETLAARPEHRGALTHWQRLPSRPARYGELALPLSGPLAEALGARGIERLYTHQVQAIEALRGGLDTVVVTGTASGKSLCYHLPVLERLLAEPEATALYLFPTKALAQDQLQGLTRLAAGHPDVLKALGAGVYDGDTQASTRRKVRDEANLILSNPDMLHQGILPAHAKWSRFLRNLRFVVIDEMHAYRGIFGSHVANVLRRLERIARHHGATFRYVMCSATIRNPGELAEALTGRTVTVVDDDGAPRGEKHFVFWNPPYVDGTRVERRSSNGEGCALFAGLLERGAQTLAFTKSRVAAELVYRYARERLARLEPGLEERVRPYRGGYLPVERRAIESALFSGELRGVVSTNALELGVDIGGLDAVVMIGAPPTLASAWQQAGRAGRQGRPSLAILVAYNETVDQYLMRHPDYFFGRSPEAACIDPHNPYILAAQLACAAYELPLSAADADAFGPQTAAIVAALDEAGETRSIDGRAYWAKTDFPAQKVGLRTISDDTYTIMDATRANAVIGTVDGISALELLYPGRSTCTKADEFRTRTGSVQKVAYVEPRTVDYYTQPVLETQIRVRHELQQREWRARRAARRVTHAWQTVAMKKIQFHSLDAIGYHRWRCRSSRSRRRDSGSRPRRRHAARSRAGLHPVEGLMGVRNLFLTLLSMLSMCDPYDLGGMIDSSNLGRAALFVSIGIPAGSASGAGLRAAGGTGARRSRTSKRASAKAAARRASGCRFCASPSSRIPISAAPARFPGRKRRELCSASGWAEEHAMANGDALRERLGELTRARRTGGPERAARVAASSRDAGTPPGVALASYAPPAVGVEGVPAGRRVAGRARRRVRSRAAALRDRAAEAPLGRLRHDRRRRTGARGARGRRARTGAVPRSRNGRARFESGVPRGHHALERRRLRTAPVFCAALRRRSGAAARRDRAGAPVRLPRHVQRPLVRRAVPRGARGHPRGAAGTAAASPRPAPRRAAALEAGAARLSAPDARVPPVPATARWDVPGEEVPGLYHDFVRRGDPYRLIPVFHHNLLDVITMAEILRALADGCHPRSL